MKVLIVKQNQKRGERYYPFRAGLLSQLKIFCMFNRIGFCGADTLEECEKVVRDELKPDPPKNSEVVKVVEI